MAKKASKYFWLVVWPLVAIADVFDTLCAKKYHEAGVTALVAGTFLMASMLPLSIISTLLHLFGETPSVPIFWFIMVTEILIIEFVPYLLAGASFRKKIRSMFNHDPFSVVGE